MAKNIIEDYLVSIGCVVNQKEFTQANKKLSGIADLLKKLFGIITTGAAAAVGAMVGLTAAIGPAGRALGNITMGVDKLALNLHTTTKNARSLQTVMQTMGIESLEDLKYINLIPEQRRQFMELRKVAAETKPTAEAREGIENLKKIGFEFQKFQVKFDNFFNEFLGGLGRALKEPLFKKVPQVLEVLLDVIKLIANEIVIFAKKLGTYKSFQDFNHRGYQDAGRWATKHLTPFKPKSEADLNAELAQDDGLFGFKIGKNGKKFNIDPFDPDSNFHNKGRSLKWKTKDQSSPAIKEFIDELKTNQSFNVSSAMPNHKGGHARNSKHYTGNALDIDVAGKDIYSIADLVSSALKVKNTKNVNLELVDKNNRPDQETYQGVMSALKMIGVSDKRITHIITPQTSGSHVHVGVGDPTENIRRLSEKASPQKTSQPLGLGGVKGGAGSEIYGAPTPDTKHTSMNINIHINGAKDAKSVGDEVIARLAPLMNSRDARGYA